LMGIVYVVENRINKKIYVGQTVLPFKRRFSHHVCMKNSLLGKAINKYGIGNFVISLNEVPEWMMDNLERNLIVIYDSVSPCGYNLDSGGNLNKHHCDSTKRKLSDINRGHHRNIGRKHTQDSRKKMSDSRYRIWEEMGHSRKWFEIECACGCGTKLMNRAPSGGLRKYVRGHNVIGTKHNSETNKRISEAMKIRVPKGSLIGKNRTPDEVDAVHIARKAVAGRR
jgi:group I intron endonuclease